MTTEWVPPGAWDQIDDWDATVAASAAPSVFLIRDWVATWWRVFGTGLEPHLLRVSSPGGESVGIAPFYTDRLRGTPARRLGLIGDRVVGSEYLGVVARRGSEAEVARAVGRWLSSPRPRWELADLTGLRAGDVASDRLVHELRAGAARTRSEDHPCASIALPGDFEEYLKTLSSKFRQSYRQRRNRLLREYDVRIFRTDSVGELSAHLDALFALHQSRWGEAGRPGVFADPRMRRFYLDVATRLLVAGRLRFWHLEVGGEIRAAQFGFVYDGVLHSLQEGYDSSFAPRGVGGLGVVLRGHVLEAAITEGLRAYDFLGGVEDHKLRWGASVHAIRRVRIARPGAAGRLAWVASVDAASAFDGAKRRLPEPVLGGLRHARAAYRRRRAGRGWR